LKAKEREATKGGERRGGVEVEDVAPDVKRAVSSNILFGIKD